MGKFKELAIKLDEMTSFSGFSWIGHTDEQKCLDKFRRSLREEVQVGDLELASLIWNWIDENDWDITQTYWWTALAAECPWAFRDTRNTNTINFAYPQGDDLDAYDDLLEKLRPSQFPRES